MVLRLTTLLWTTSKRADPWERAVLLLPVALSKGGTSELSSSYLSMAIVLVLVMELFLGECFTADFPVLWLL